MSREAPVNRRSQGENIPGRIYRRNSPAFSAVQKPCRRSRKQPTQQGNSRHQKTKSLMRTNPTSRHAFFSSRALIGFALCSVGLLLALVGLSESVTGAAGLSSVALKPTTVVQGTPSLGTVTLDAPAPTGGATVTLASLNQAVVTVPGSVMVAQGATSALSTLSKVPLANTPCRSML